MKLLQESYIKYALLMSLITTICLMLMEITGQNQSFDKNPLQAIFMFIAPFVLWFFGILEKKKGNKGKLKFKDGVVEGFKISLVYGLVSPFIFLVYYLFINPSILDYVKTAYNLTSAGNTMVIAVDMIIQFLASIIFGTIYSTIISAILKTKK